MNNIKFAGFGWDGYTGQITRIKEGFKSLGHELTYDNPDIIFCNDPGQYVKAIQHKQKYPKAFLILPSIRILAGSSKASFMETKKVTASFPSSNL